MKNQRLQQFALDFYEEPFRIFFPVGILLGIAGVALWPAYYAGLILNYPGTTHARLMIEGFMASFIIGFLGTAGPRVTSTFPFLRREVIVLLTLELLAAGLHFGDSHRAGDVLFIVCLAFFLFSIGRRFLYRKDSPPPNFALVALGLLNGLVGTILLALSENEVYSATYRIGAAILEQGFVLLPILGVAPFLLPRLLGTPPADNPPESPNLPPDWVSQAVFAATIGLTIDGTFVAEAFGAIVAVGWLRFGIILIYLIARMPWRGRSFLGDYLRFGIAGVAVAVGIEVLWPQYRIGALHIMFISGFSLVALTVATRVVFGHSGNAHLLRKRLPFFMIAAVFIFLAMLSRYVADLVPRARTMHLVAAATCWLIAALIWMVRVVPKVTIAEPEQ